MTYQSLYRRYRPQRFADVLGQDHVSATLRNAVRTGKVAHAYLFSGPRGCGKTTSARILAKALNCTDLQDGEPCGVCESCLQVASGASMDVNELDAASNNGVDAMRDLVARASLGTSGRRKVYIVDEVHMLSAAASNALLKTLEEPPDHVVFVLATTDPQKVLPTIRSRTQHFEFRLFPLHTLTDLVRSVATDAGLGLDEATIEAVARKGNGSARDALSALDQVAAAGGIDDSFDVSELGLALAARDAAGVLTAVDRAIERGRDPRQLARDLIELLREVFLTQMGLPRTLTTPPMAERMGPAAVTRAIEVLGEALVTMRESLDPRITLDVALVRLVRADLDVSPAALAERLERLERHAGAGGPVVAPPPALPPRAAPAAAPAPPARLSVPQAVAPRPDADAAVTPPPRSPHDASSALPAAAGVAPDPVAAPPGVALGPPSTAPTDAPAPPAPSAPPPAPAAPGGLPRLTTSAASAAPPVAAAPRRGAADGARAVLGGSRGPGAARTEAARPPAEPRPVAPDRARPSSPAGAAEAVEPATAPPATGASFGAVTLASLNAAREAMLDQLERKARALLAAGRFVSADEQHAEFGLPNAMHLSRCADWGGRWEAVVQAFTGAPVRVQLIVDPSGGLGAEVPDQPFDGSDDPPFGSPAGVGQPGAGGSRPASAADRGGVSAPADEHEIDDIDVHDLVDAPAASIPTTLDHLTQAFPGAQVVEEGFPR